MLAELHGPPRWTIVVRAADTALYAKLREQFVGASWVAVHLDRRRGDRRQATGLPEVERRWANRRANREGSPLPRSHRLSHEPPGCAVYELVDLEAATDCPTCGQTVWFEMPRFGEPPRRLELKVDHEDVTPRRPRHIVDVDAFGVTGRPLLNFRVVARLGGATR